MAMLFAAAYFAAAPATAYHPEEDQAIYDDHGIPQSNPNPTVDCAPEWDDEGYASLDYEIWRCKFDPGIPEAPGTGGWYWEPEPPLPADGTEGPTDDGDTKFMLDWEAVPNHTPQLYHRRLSRTEWLDINQGNDCTQVACVLKVGADVHVVTANGQPYTVPANSLRNAHQLYKWDGAAWVKVGDTGWYTSTVATDRMLQQWNWGTAPFGAAYYKSLGWSAQVINGTHVTVGGAVQAPMIWDPPPGYDSKKPPKPDKPLKPQKVKPTVAQPELEGRSTPTAAVGF
jgi:hypothetical protein